MTCGKCCNIVQISGGVDPETLEFLVQGGDSDDTGAPTSGPVPVNLGAGNILHIWSGGTAEIDVQAGSAVVQIEAANISSGAGAPVAPPADATRVFTYFDTSDDSVWYWDVGGAAWVQVPTGGGPSVPICVSDTYANIALLVGSLTAGCWYEITDANLPQGASSVLIQATTASDFATRVHWLHSTSGAWLTGEYDFASDNLYYAYDPLFSNEMRGLNAVYGFIWRLPQVRNVRAYNVDVLDFSGHNNAIVENVLVTGEAAQFILVALQDGELRNVEINDSFFSVNLPAAFGFINGVKAFDGATIEFDTFGPDSDVNTMIAISPSSNINIMAQGADIIISDLETRGTVTITGTDSNGQVIIGGLLMGQNTLFEMDTSTDTVFSRTTMDNQSLLVISDLTGGSFANNNLSGNTYVRLANLTNVNITDNEYSSANVQHSNSTGGLITENKFKHTGDKPTPCVIECNGGVNIAFNEFVNQAVVNITAPTGGGEIAGNYVGGEGYLTLANLALGAIFKDNRVVSQSEFNGDGFSGSVVGCHFESGAYAEALAAHQGAFENSHVRCGMNVTIESNPAINHVACRLAGLASSPYTFTAGVAEVDIRVDD